MSGSTFDSMESIWIEKDRTPDWDAMFAMTDETDDPVYVRESIARLRACLAGEAPDDGDWTFLDVGPFRLWLGFDCEWNTALLDEHGISMAGGFFREPQCQCQAGPHSVYDVPPECPFQWFKGEDGDDE